MEWAPFASVAGVDRIDDETSRSLCALRNARCSEQDICWAVAGYDGLFRSATGIERLMWKWIWRRGLTARRPATAEAPPAEPPVGTVSGRAVKVASKYVSLHKYLANRYADSVVLTFAQLEDLIGGPLPDSARAQDEWWTSTDRDADKSSCADAWILAGRTAKPNLLARTVTFERPIESPRDSRSLA